MTSRVTLAKRLDALEAAPSKARPLRIVGGLTLDLLAQGSRATVTSPSGHMSVYERAQNESFAAFLTRLNSVPGTLTLGGMPPLPGTSLVSTEGSM